MKLARPHDPHNPPGSSHKPTPTSRSEAHGGEPASGGAGGNDLGQAITVLRARVDEEFRISERLDSKARQAFALGTGFFVVVQTVAFGGFAQATVNSTERVLLLAGAVVAAGALLIVAHRLSNGEELLDEADFKPEKIVQWCDEAGSDSEYVSVRLVSELAHMTRRRAENNVIRGRNYDKVVFAARWALILAGVELLTAIAVRL
jgi:hypothetical protein